MRRKYAVILVFALGIGYVGSQEFPVTPFTVGESLEIGARVFGLGGAFTSVADDYTALYYNPAGLGQIKAVGVFGSFSRSAFKDHLSFLGKESSEDASYTQLGSMGVVFPLPTYRGSLVLAAGYHRLRGFDGSFSVSSDLVVESPLLFDTVEVVLPFEVSHAYEEFSEGYLSETSLGGSVEVAPDVYLGGSVNFWSGFRDLTQKFSEIGGIYEATDVLEPGDAWEIMRPDTIISRTYREEYSGVNFSFGALVKAGEIFRIGGMIKTPVTLTADREWGVRIREQMYPGYEEFQQPDSTDSGFIDYKVQHPWVFRLGGSVKAGLLLLSGDIELNDYSQVQYKSDSPEEGYMNRGEANRDLRRSYRNTMNYHIGGECTVQANVKLRAGYGLYRSPYKDALSEWDRKVVSFGAGFGFGEGFVLDVGYGVVTYKAPFFEVIQDEIIQHTKIEMNKILVSLTYQW